mgnify:FL=1
MPCTVHDKQIRFHDDDKHYFNFHESRPYTLYGARQTKFDFHDARQSKIADNAARRNPIAPSIYNVRRKEWRVLWMTKVFTSANLTSFLFWKDWDHDGHCVLCVRKVVWYYQYEKCISFTQWELVLKKVTVIILCYALIIDRMLEARIKLFRAT